MRDARLASNTLPSETAACFTGLSGFLTIAWMRLVPGRPEKATAACFRLPTWMLEEAGGCVPWGLHSSRSARCRSYVRVLSRRASRAGWALLPVAGLSDNNVQLTFSDLTPTRSRNFELTSAHASYDRAPNTPVTTRSFPHRSRRIVTDSNPADSSIPPTVSH